MLRRASCRIVMHNFFHGRGACLFMGRGPRLPRPTRAGSPPALCYLSQSCDGIRCLADAHGLWSRHGTRIASCQHLEGQLGAIIPQASRPRARRRALRSRSTRGAEHDRQPRQHTPAQFGEAAPVSRAHRLPRLRHAVTSRPGYHALAALLATLAPCLGLGSGIHLVITTPASSAARLDQLYADYLGLRLRRADDPARCALRAAALVVSAQAQAAI